MPDRHGNFKGISVPELPWTKRRQSHPPISTAPSWLRPLLPVTEQEDEAFQQLDSRPNGR